jgi:hypothetical protein
MWYVNEAALQAELEHRQAMLRAEIERARWAALARQRPGAGMPMERSPRPWWAWWPAAWSRRAVATQSAPPGPA